MANNMGTHPGLVPEDAFVSDVSSNMAELISSILDDCLYNLIRDTVLQVHREEKLARMQSAAILAHQAAQKKTLSIVDSDEEPTVTFAGAIETDDGKIHLRGNPLKTTSTILCPNCNLPRIVDSTSKHSTSSKSCCAKTPYISHPFLDIHGRSLTAAAPPLKKSSKSSISNISKPYSPSSSSSATVNGNSPPDEKHHPLPIPSTRCPSCQRYFLVSRIAWHLDKCIGISGRQSGRDALAKIKTGVTPKDSRDGTPLSKQGIKDDAETGPRTPLKEKKKRKAIEREDESGPLKKKRLVQKKIGHDVEGESDLSNGPNLATTQLENPKNREGTEGVEVEDGAVLEE